jgi:hypothetical protein
MWPLQVWRGVDSENGVHAVEGSVFEYVKDVGGCRQSNRFVSIKQTLSGLHK